MHGPKAQRLAKKEPDHHIQFLQLNKTYEPEVKTSRYQTYKQASSLEHQGAVMSHKHNPFLQRLAIFACSFLTTQLLMSSPGNPYTTVTLFDLKDLTDSRLHVCMSGSFQLFIYGGAFIEKKKTMRMTLRRWGSKVEDHRPSVRTCEIPKQVTFSRKKKTDWTVR